MSCGEWVYGPFGLDSAKGRTCENQRTVLVVVHTVTAGTRLADVVPLLESDERVQVVFTCAPSSVFSREVPEYLRGLDAVVVPWRQATQTRFDLAIAASSGLLEQLHAPVLVLPHGVGFGKYVGRWPGYGPHASRELSGPQGAQVIYRGRVVPSAVVVPTRRQLDQVANTCPEVLRAAVVGGDPAYDRLLASLPLRDTYRRALDVGERKLISVSSTWGPGSLLPMWPGLLQRLVRDLPSSEYRVAAILHPNVWSWHGRRQVRAWYAGCVRRGLSLLPPEEGWRGVLAAADFLIGDHGSVTCYAAAIGLPVALGTFPVREVTPLSASAKLASIAPVLNRDQPIAPQLERASSSWPAGAQAEVRALITDFPGQSAPIIQSMMYRLMCLVEPETAPEVRPAAVPEPVVIPGAVPEG
jgi:hypothetical protein